MYHETGYESRSYLTKDDVDHLNLLSLAHVVLGVLGVVVSGFVLLYVLLGVAMLLGPVEVQGAPPVIGLGFIAIGVVGFFFGALPSVALILSGRCLKRRTGYTFSFIVACVSCIHVPLGTALGICTILVLVRPSVKAAYGRP
ncbi:MAG: hypothetical protein KF886_02335 [Candidatus Hydrogenedentes bacterium]|nr:hypothetical protein [Candidatus Hydrogenedentota bacterium]